MAATAFAPSELRQLVKGIKGIWASGANPDLVKQFNTSSGQQPYDLSPALTYLYPAFSPVRNRMTRMHVQGKNFEYKAITNPDSSNASGEAVEGQLAPSIVTQFADVIANFKSYGVATDPVTYEQLYAGEGKSGDFNIDSRRMCAA